MRTILQKRSNQRGDTIVEVLLAIAIIGAVLGGAYVAANRNSMINRASQERLEAIKIAEGQLERLKAKAASDSTVFSQTNFCINTANTLVTSTNAQCRVNSSGNPTTGEPSYRIVITKEGDLDAGPLVPGAGAQFKVTITWAEIRGGGTDTLEMQYGVYR